MSDSYINELSGLITDLLEIEAKEDIVAYFNKIQSEANSFITYLHNSPLYKYPKLEELAPNTRYRTRKFAYEIFCVCQNILSKMPTLEERTIFLKKARKIIKERY